MKTIITVLGISAILLSFTPVAKAQSNNLPTGEATLSGDSLKNLEGRSISNDNYRTYISEPESQNPPNEVKYYELRRQQNKVEVVPGVSIPVDSNESKSQNPLEEKTLEGDKSGEGFKLRLGI